MNGCIWGQTEGKSIDRRHIGTIDLVDLKKRIVDNVEKQLPLIPLGVRKFLDLRSLEVVGSMKATLAAICTKHRLEKSQSTEVLMQFSQHEKDHRNLFGIVNAITRAGQTMDNESWVKLDELGGELVDYTADRWESIGKFASSMSVKDIDEIFAVA
jgi:hypothetical protein